jgi:protein O-GlcNAc transferase
MDISEVSHRLDEAISLAQSQHLNEAEILLRHLVASGVREPKACMVLGVLCGARGERGERRVWFEQARRLEVAAGRPPSLRLLLNQSVDALEAGEVDQALACGQQALDLYPGEVDAHLHQARLLHKLGQIKGAHQQLDRLRADLETRNDGDPGAMDGWRQLARAEQDLGRREAATAAWRHALRLDPNHLPSLLAIIQLHLQMGAAEEAMPWLMNALAVAPEDANVLCGNGFALKAIGEVRQAEEMFRHALSIDPTHLNASQLLGNCLVEQGQIIEAETTFKSILSHYPDDLDSRLGLAHCRRLLGDMQAALTLQEELMEDEPQNFASFSSWMFLTSISAGVPPEDVLATARRFWHRYGADLRPWPARPRAGDRPLRVGLLSADIGEHVVGLFLDPLLRHHDPTVCQLELLSMCRRYDRMSEELVSLADGFESLEGLPVAEARELLRQRDYDLIVDISGHTSGTGLHLLAERCAPVQAHYIGYHATTGLPTLDAFIGDEETAAADLQSQFSERLWRLPRPWLAFPRQPTFPEARPGMQTDRPVLGSFCQLSKINDQTLAFWAAALRRVPDAVLLLKSRGLQDPGVRGRLEERLQRLGVEPGRLIFVAPLDFWWHHVEHYNYLDVALDTTPWSSATTGFEALGMGVPVVAIRGDQMAARMSSALLKGLGREEWISQTPDDFADIVAKLCGELDQLRQDKGIRQRETFDSPLFDGPGLATSVTDLFKALVASTLDPLVRDETMPFVLD